MIKQNHLTVLLFAASLLLSPFAVADAVAIKIPAKMAVKELGVICQKLTVAKNACVIAFFDESEEQTIAKNHTYYRVLQGKNSVGYYVAQGFYRSGVKRSNSVQVKNDRSILDGRWRDDMELEGLETVWYESGQKLSEVAYHNGAQVGKRKYWNQNGEPDGSFE